MFKIISVGWNCAPFLTQTIMSVQAQTVTDWQHAIVYDKSDDNGMDILLQLAEVEPRILLRLNAQQNYAPHNQYEALQMLAPEPDDIVVWLDLDGDCLAHPKVLQHVADEYADGVTLLTYGTYHANPCPSTPPPISPIPDDVTANGTHRKDALYNGPRFNHLRTMKGKIANSIPVQSFQWRQQPGKWYLSGADYLWMISGLELARERYKLIPEILVQYNDANPYQDNKMHMEETSACDIDFLNGVPLARLP